MSAALNDPHWLHERAIFERFLACAPGLRVRPDSLRRGDGYDLACVGEAGDELAFELTEVTDHWANSKLRTRTGSVKKLFGLAGKSQLR